METFLLAANYISNSAESTEQCLFQYVTAKLGKKKAFALSKIIITVFIECSHLIPKETQRSSLGRVENLSKMFCEATLRKVLLHKKKKMVTNGELAVDCGLVSVNDVIYMDTHRSCSPSSANAVGNHFFAEGSLGPRPRRLGYMLATLPSLG